MLGLKQHLAEKLGVSLEKINEVKIPIFIGTLNTAVIRRIVRGLKSMKGSEFYELVQMNDYLYSTSYEQVVNARLGIQPPATQPAPVETLSETFQLDARSTAIDLIGLLEEDASFMFKCKTLYDGRIVFTKNELIKSLSRPDETNLSVTPSEQAVNRTIEFLLTNGYIHLYGDTQPVGHSLYELRVDLKEQLEDATVILNKVEQQYNHYKQMFEKQTSLVEKLEREAIKSGGLSVSNDEPTATTNTTQQQPSVQNDLGTDNGAQ